MSNTTQAETTLRDAAITFEKAFIIAVGEDSPFARHALKPFREAIKAAGNATANSTPAAAWRVDGDPDPHGKDYDCERAALTLGKFTDDELANGVFMNGDQPMNIERVIAHDPDYHTPLVWLTAAKERIRWLSRALVKATQQADVAPTKETGHD